MKTTNNQELIAQIRLALINVMNKKNHSKLEKSYYKRIKDIKFVKGHDRGIVIEYEEKQTHYAVNNKFSYIQPESAEDLLYQEYKKIKECEQPE